MRKLRRYFYIIVFLTFIVSCSDDNETVFNNLDEFHASNLNPEIHIINKNETDVIIWGSKGSKLIIPQNAISHIEGEMKILFKELFNKSDLILNNIPTNAIEGNWLESGGSFFIQIEDSNGSRVYLNENIILEFPISDKISDITNMSVWTGDGETIFNNGNGSNEFSIWRNISFQNTTASVEINETSNEFIMYTPSYNWINCDYIFDTNSELTKVKVEITNREIDPSEINTYLVLKNINSVLRLEQNGFNFESFSIPINEEAYIVSVAVKNEIYLKIEPIVIERNQEFSLNLNSVDTTELYETIKILDN